MSGGERKKGLALGRFAPVAWVALSWLAAWFTAGNEFRTSPHTWSQILDFLDRFTFKAFGGFPAAQEYVANLIRVIDWTAFPTFVVYGGWSMFLVPLGFVVRMVARARVRSGAKDPLDRLRSWVAAHPRWWAALLGVLPAIWGIKALDVLIHDHWGWGVTPAQMLPVVALSALFEYGAARATFRAFLQPTVDPEEESRIEIGPDEIRFNAVAVTRETRAAVGGLAGVSVAMMILVGALPLATLFRDARLFGVIAAYALFAAASATLFRIASRVAVGVDGIHVTGTSRTRFFAYRDIDAVRIAGGDIEIVRRDRVVLRLQLHGADAVRRDAVAARVRENIDRVQRGEHAVAAQLVSSASHDQLARVASGGADYRAASLSREALWKLIEGPAVDSDARRAAAQALAKTCDDSERARLRVAAEHCADPRVRVALAELAEGPREAHENAASRVAASRM